MFGLHSAQSRVSRAFGRTSILAAAIVTIGACHSDATGPTYPAGFLGGTSSEHEIGLVVNSTGNTVTLFQLGSPTTQKQISLGTSSTITAVGLSTGGTHAAVPLGNAASVALIDLTTTAITRFFTFASGNATGSAFSNDTTVFAANTATNQVGRFTTGQSSSSITTLVTVATQPTAINFVGGRVLVTSANLDANFNPIGNGIVTAIDPTSMAILGTATTGGTNPNTATVGPDGLLYVLNTGDYVGEGSLTVINPATMQVVRTVSNMGVGPGDISIDANGLAYVSGFFTGTLVWNTKTLTFVRGESNPVCAMAQGSCRGAFASTTNSAGNLYQAFFGSSSQQLPPYIFVFKAGTFALSDSITVGPGPASIAIRTF